MRKSRRGKSRRTPRGSSLPKIPSEKFVLIFSILVFTAVILLNYETIKVRITSWATFSDVGVAIEPLTKGVITQIILKSRLLLLGEKQTVFVEFHNIGSSTLDMKIEHHYYVYNESRLDIVASYYDSRVLLPAGSKRRFNTTFIAPVAGLYYVQIRIPHNNKVVQTWESFYVYSVGPPATVPVTIITPPPAPPVAGPAKASIIAPDKVAVVQGDYETFEVSVINVGDRVLNNLKFYTSIPDLLNISINPKMVRSLGLNSSSLFLVTVGAPSDVEEGVYLLEIEFATEEVKYSEKIDIEVVSSNITDITYLWNLIVNYEYLISRIDSEIYSAALEGYDVSVANESLNNARAHLNLAKDYFEKKEYDDTKKELTIVIKYLQDAVFQLASVTLYVYRPPAYSPIFLFLLEAFLALLIFLLIYLYRRKKRKPKALRKET